MASKLLIDEIQGERTKWARSTIVYGTLNVIIRLFLILFSGIVAAGKTLADSFEFSFKWISVIAAAVAILTAIDSWLKPRDKWRGFMEDRDDISDLLISAQASQGDDTTTLDKFRNQFKELRRRHRNKNVY